MHHGGENSFRRKLFFHGMRFRYNKGFLPFGLSDILGLHMKPQDISL